MVVATLYQFHLSKAQVLVEVQNEITDTVHLIDAEEVDEIVEEND